jgi:hypothetical protein
MIASRQRQGTSAYGNSYLSCEAAAELIPVFPATSKHLGDVEPGICGRGFTAELVQVNPFLVMIVQKSRKPSLFAF